MTTQVVTAEELIGYLTDIVEAHGDIPVIVGSEDGTRAESVGRPAVIRVAPTGNVNDFQACDYARRQDARQIKAALIN